MHPQKTSSAPRPFWKAQPIWFTGLIAVLALVPLPFGANRPWASDLLGLVCGVLLALCARDLRRDPSLWPEKAPWKRLGFAGFALVTVLLWGIAQTLGIFQPHPLWDSAAEILGQPVSAAMSLTPAHAGESLLRILSYAACFVMAFLGARDTARAQLLLKSLAAIAVAYAFYGLLMDSSGLNVVLWYKKWAYQDRVTSTFINKNTYATYAGLGLLCCLARIWHYIKKRPSSRLWAVALEQMGARDLYAIAAILTVLGALLLSQSRGGIASSFVGSLAFLIALALNREWTGRKWLTIFLPGLVLLGAFATFNTGMLLDSLDVHVVQDQSVLRLNAYETISRALADNPLQGFGLGSFENAFRLYRNEEVQEWFEHAHDDYLEIAMELGIPIALLYVAGILSLVSCCAQGVFTRHKQEIYVVLAIGATVVVAMHGLIDFSMEIPAVAATYAAILGMGVAQSWSSRHNGP